MEYKVICDVSCLTASHKARKLEAHLNTSAKDGWRYCSLEPVLLLGIDVGFYLTLQRGTATP